MKHSLWTCTCGHDRFKVESRDVNYRRDIRREPAIVCLSCNRAYGLATSAPAGMVRKDRE